VTTYLLDTNIVSDLVRNPQGQIAAKIASVGEQNIATSIIVAAELRFGAEKKGSQRLADQLEAILSSLPVLPLAHPSDSSYGQLRAELERAGTPIGANDMLIAAHAQALGAILVSDNEREFSRVRSLQLENWLR